MTSKIPIGTAEFFWNAEPGQLPTGFVAVDKATRMAERRGTGEDQYRHLGCSTGAHCDDWLTMGGNSPEAVFANVFLDDLPKPYRDTIAAGLREFSKVEGQDWAMRMLETLDRWTASHEQHGAAE